jgi:hypothetical protein
MLKLNKKKAFTFLTFSILPTLTWIGAILGYYLTKFLAGRREGERGKIKSLILSFSRWQIHLHHWLLGATFLFFSLWFNILPLPQFSVGFLSGMIFQGLTYSDWHRIFLKKECLN